MRPIRRNSWVFGALFMGVSWVVQGQTLDREVSLSYHEVSLEAILADLGDAYNLRFTYSSSLLPLQRRLSVQVNRQPLGDALWVVCKEAEVEYRSIGGQIVLRPNPAPVPELTQKELPKEVPQETPLYQDEQKQEIFEARQELWRSFSPRIRERSFPEQVDQPYYPYVIENLERYQMPVPKPDPPPPTNRFAQVSLLPYLGTNAVRSPEINNKVSLNLLWGTNGGVQGVEVGGIGNTIQEDVVGMQLAGLINTVGDDVYGTQIGGLFNMVADTMAGVQIAGLFNVAGNTDAFQVATLFNITAHEASGMQSALGFNISGGSADGAQTALGFNYAGGDVRFQTSLLLNRARNVERGQLGLLMNIAREVNGDQVGLINVADSIIGVPVGLINIVRKGYNSLEIATSDVFYGNIGLKMGVRAFYNIFYLGGRSDDRPDEGGGEVNWGLGYGLGTSAPLARNFYLNLEILSMHVNEEESWTRELNQLNQLRVLFEGRVGRRTSLFVGPVGNWMVSKRRDPETGELIGSGLAPGAGYAYTRNGVNTKLWLGFTAGIRL